MLKTACKSNAERLMTFSTSEVAVCCCKASARSSVLVLTSLNRRTFSIAITAWSAKVCTSLIWLGETVRAQNAPAPNKPITSPSRNIGITTPERTPPIFTRLLEAIFGIVPHVLVMTVIAGMHGTAPVQGVL